jgi:hypothetical protein
MEDKRNLSFRRERGSCHPSHDDLPPKEDIPLNLRTVPTSSPTAFEALAQADLREVLHNNHWDSQSLVPQYLTRWTGIICFVF